MTAKLWTHTATTSMRLHLISYFTPITDTWEQSLSPFSGNEPCGDQQNCKAELTEDTACLENASQTR